MMINQAPAPGFHLRFVPFACLCSCLLLAGCRTAPPESPEASVKPGVNTSYLEPDLDVSRAVERFEREGREVYDQRAAIVARAGLRPGMRVADIGAGTGLFTFLFGAS